MRPRICFGLAATLLLIASAQPLKVNYRTERTHQGNFYTIDIRMPVFPKENPVGTLANKEVESIVNQFKSDFLKTMAENRNNKYLSRVSEPFLLQIRPTISIARANLVSLYLEIFWWTGGAHPNTFYRVVNVGMVNGKPRVLQLRDVLEPGVTPETVTQRVAQQVETIKRERDPSQEPWMPEEGIPQEYWNRFILTPNAIVWVLEPYAVGAYAEGSFFPRLRYDELRGLVRRL